MRGLRGSSSVVAEYNDAIIINDNDVINYERSIINHGGASICRGAVHPAPASRCTYLLHLSTAPSLCIRSVQAHRFPDIVMPPGVY